MVDKTWLVMTDDSQALSQSSFAAHHTQTYSLRIWVGKEGPEMGEPALY